MPAARWKGGNWIRGALAAVPLCLSFECEVSGFTTSMLETMEVKIEDWWRLGYTEGNPRKQTLYW